MSLAQGPQEYRASPLMSNNPFRNRITTTQTQTQTQPPPPLQTQNVRPVSTNPFLDSNELQKQTTSPIQPASAVTSNGISDIFASMKINGDSRSPDRKPKPTVNGFPPRPANAPPRPFRSPPLTHRPTLSGEDQGHTNPARQGTELDIFADPADGNSIRERTSRRRNSESSVRDKASILDPDEEKRRRDRKSRDPRPGKYRPSRRMDVIDKLDVTSIYGTGLFHHDGPFDACNPNRNKRRHRFAPMQAFPKDSANMQIGGSGPVNKQMDYARFHGLEREAHRDFNEAAVADEDTEYMRRIQPVRSTSYNPTAIDPVHGQETIGLGATTFLEGAPASRIAIERRDSEMNEAQQQTNSGGLSRKKSLAQKLRGVRGSANRVQSPDSDQPPNSPLATGKSDNVNNPFFKDYDKEYEKKGAQISQTEEVNQPGRARAMSSPKPVPSLERQVTSENMEPSQDGKPGGLLSRMKSLKKTKSRPDRRDAS